MSRYRLVAEPAANLDVASAFRWYEGEKPGLGSAFLDELAATYERVADGPLHYEGLQAGIRRALLKRFPYAVYFTFQGDVVVIVGVLQASRDPAEWQRRRQ